MVEPAKAMTSPLIAAALFLIVGCRRQQADSRLAEYQQALDPLVGKGSKTDLVRMLGVPQGCTATGEREFCRFRSSYGVRGNQYGASEVFDQVDAEFDRSGRFLTWRAYVQR